VDWWNPTTWDANAWQTAAAIGAGIVATVAIVAVVVAATGCVVATLGVCGAVLLGAGIVAGAAGAAVTYGIQPGDKSADGLGQAVLWGGATGVVGVVGSALIGKALSVVGPKLLAALSKSGAATEAGGGILSNQAAGNAARDTLAAENSGSLTEQTFQTSLGARRVDVLTQDGLAIESKVGRTSLTSDTVLQIAKDQLLLNNPRISGVTWVFTRSGVTGNIGPTGPLATALDKAGIPWMLGQ
jgi:hypothetical protein